MSRFDAAAEGGGVVWCGVCGMEKGKTLGSGARSPAVPSQISGHSACRGAREAQQKSILVSTRL